MYKHYLRSMAGATTGLSATPGYSIHHQNHQHPFSPPQITLPYSLLSKSLERASKKTKNKNYIIWKKQKDWERKGSSLLDVCGNSLFGLIWGCSASFYATSSHWLHKWHSSPLEMCWHVHSAPGKALEWVMTAKHVRGCDTWIVLTI